MECLKVSIPWEEKGLPKMGGDWYWEVIAHRYKVSYRNSLEVQVIMVVSLVTVRQKQAPIVYCRKANREQFLFIYLFVELPYIFRKHFGNNCQVDSRVNVEIKRSE